MNKIEAVAKRVHEEMGPKYWWTPDAYEVRPYHGSWHIADTRSRTVFVVDTVRRLCPDLITHEEEEAAEAAAWAHDVDQSCIYTNGPNGKMRKRFSGPIEGASAIWLARTMDEIGGFTPHQKEVAVEAIMGTVPAWDAAKKRLIQPNLKSGVRVTTIILALADIGGGVIGGAPFAKEGRLVFTEDHLYVLDALQACNMLEVPENAQDLCEKVVAYLESQISFLKGVADRVEEEMLPLVPEKARDPIRSVCVGTPAAHKAAVEVHDWAQGMLERKDYMNLFRFMGYRV